MDEFGEFGHFAQVAGGEELTDPIRLLRAADELQLHLEHRVRELGDLRERSRYGTGRSEGVLGAETRHVTCSGREPWPRARNG